MENEYKIQNLIKMVVILVLIVAIFYGLTIIITKNKQQPENNETPGNTEIQYDEILIGDIYNQNENEYYVLVELEEEEVLKNLLAKREENYLKAHYVIDTSNLGLDEIIKFILGSIDEASS